jgi:GNAT superfamily N-acetyltransferase
MNVVRLGTADAHERFAEVAEIHIAEVHHGCLPALGVKSLARLYRELAAAPASGVWAAIEDDRVVGFVSGCGSARKMYRAVLAQAVVPLLLASIRSMLGRGLIRNLCAMMLYPFRRPRVSAEADRAVRDGSEPELLAIAVRGPWQGRGVGRRLIAAFEQCLPSWANGSRYYVSTNIAEAASNEFYRKMGFVACGTMRYHHLTLQVYRKDTLERLPDRADVADRAAAPCDPPAASGHSPERSRADDER